MGGERDTIVPFTNIRRRTAEHMVRSKPTSAHTMVAVEVDYSGVEKVRQAERTRFREAEGFSLTYLPFMTRAVVDALADFPHVNSSVGDDALIVHHDLNIGIAVDLDFEGLLVPVIHQADGKRLRALAREISGLATRARAKRLTMDDISGGTFTITNAGPFGTFITVPVINQPQVAILSTDGVSKRPVVVELPDGSDGIAVHPVGNLVLSWDHRAFDGAYAAAFVAAIKQDPRDPGLGRRAVSATAAPSPLAGPGPLPGRPRPAAGLWSTGHGRLAAAARAPPRVHARGAGPGRARPRRPGSRRSRAGAQRPGRRRHLPRAGSAGRLPDHVRAHGPQAVALPRSPHRAAGHRRARRPRACRAPAGSTATPGVWVDPDGPNPRKICAIGVRVSRAVPCTASPSTWRRTCRSSTTSFRAASPTSR